MQLAEGAEQGEESGPDGNEGPISAEDPQTSEAVPPSEEKNPGTAADTAPSTTADSDPPVIEGGGGESAETEAGAHVQSPQEAQISSN